MSTAKERGERIKALAREYRLTQKRWPSVVWDDLNREIDSLVEQAGAVPLTDEQIDDWIDAKWHEACTTHGGRTQEFVRWFGRECLKAGREQGLEEAIRAIEEVDDPWDRPSADYFISAIRARAGAGKGGV